MSDDENKPHHATARPPPGEEDVYSASTVVGEASDEILALIRGDNPKPAIPSAPTVPTIDERPAKPAEPAPAAAAEAAPPPSAPAPPSVPAPVTAPPPAPALAPAKTVDPTPPDFRKGAMPPVFGIVLFFVAVVVVLALLLR